MRPGFINSFAPTVIQTLPAPLPSDYWHVSNAKYTASSFVSQQSIPGSGSGAFGLNTINELFAVPFFVGRQGRIVTSLGGRWVIAPTAGGVVKLGIYDVLPASAHNVYPQNLVASVELTVSGSTGVQVGTLTSPVSLSNGLYWAVIAKKSGNLGSIRGISGAGANQVAGRNPLQWAGSTLNSYLRVTLPDASALPAEFASGATMQSGGAPIIEVL